MRVSLCYFYVATMSSAVIRANVLANQRPKLSDNCSKGFRQLITRCWSDQPDSRLDFGGKTITRHILGKLWVYFVTIV